MRHFNIYLLFFLPSNPGKLKSEWQCRSASKIITSCILYCIIPQWIQRTLQKNLPWEQETWLLMHSNHLFSGLISDVFFGLHPLPHSSLICSTHCLWPLPHDPRLTKSELPWDFCQSHWKYLSQTASLGVVVGIIYCIEREKHNEIIWAPQKASQSSKSLFKPVTFEYLPFLSKSPQYCNW